MRRLIVFALAGLGAQLVDGALGMGYGVTSTTLLLLAGTSPVVASASVHLAEVGTTLTAGTAHWRFGNVDWKLVARLGVPGAIGAFAGATVLSSVSTELAKPWTAGILLVLGAYTAVRFAIRPPKIVEGGKTPSKKMLAPLGAVAGFVDATGGGGWGPISTSTLLSAGKQAPRTVIGSVDASEFLVALAASAGFLLGLGREGLLGVAVLGLLIGGLIAAPIAAWLVHRLPTTVLGSAVGCTIILTNARTIFDTFEVSSLPRNIFYVSVLFIGLALVTMAVRRHRAGADGSGSEHRVIVLPEQAAEGRDSTVSAH